MRLNLPFHIRKICSCCSAAALSLLSLAGVSPAALHKDSHQVVVDTFSLQKDSNSNLPPGWHPSRKDISMFSIQQENSNVFARINTEGGCTSFGKQIKYSAEEYPFLSWKWRVHNLPEGGDETQRRKNDSGAAIYIIFKGNFRLNNVLKYVWSSSLPIGTVTSSPYNKRAKVIVLKSGAGNAGNWFSETVNIQKDYQRLFGGKMPPVEGIAILSDSDNTSSSAVADYDDIKIEKSGYKLEQNERG